MEKMLAQLFLADAAHEPIRAALALTLGHPIENGIRAQGTVAPKTIASREGKE